MSIFKRQILIAVVFVLLSQVATLAARAQQQQPNASGLRMTSVGAELPESLLRIFATEVDVFNVKVLATASTQKAKVMHAANVLAQYLDNDADGEPDNALVIQAMRKNKATLVMFATSAEAEKAFRLLENAGELLDDRIMQDLYGEETHPAGASQGVFDAAYEEVLHLITHAGYAHAYPGIFGERPGTKLSIAMDRARGRRFLKVPARYPAKAWYTYDDETCDYGCQTTEYIYWGLTSLLGAQDFPGRMEEIKHEWRLNTPESFENGDPALYQLLTDRRYGFPTILPDGNYTPNPN